MTGAGRRRVLHPGQHRRRQPGHNHFSLRGATAAAAGQVPSPGNTYMGIYANVGGNQLTQFYLARVPTAAAGPHARVELLRHRRRVVAGHAAGHPAGRQQRTAERSTEFNGCKWTGNAAAARSVSRPTRRPRRGARSHRLDNDLHDPRRQRAGHDMERAVEHGDGPDPDRLHVQRQRPATVAGSRSTTCSRAASHDIDVVERGLLGDPVRLVK